MKLSLGAQQDAVQRRIDALASSGATARVFARDAAFWGDDAERQKSVANRLGWLDVAATMRARVGEIEAFTRDARAAGFRDAVLLGMGGSSLAPEVLRQSIAVTAPADGLTLHVLDTTDPATIAHVTESIDVATTLFFVSSKSGGTIEPNALFAYYFDLVQGVKPDRAGENFVAITDAGTSMQKTAEAHNFRRIFMNPSDIGGRYSALSYFGLVPAAVARVDVAKLIERGIAAADAEKAAPDGEGLRLGAALGELALAGRDKCTFVVSPRIASFGLWVEQLIAESMGKLGKGVLPVAGEPLGQPGQYSADRLFVQLRLDDDENDQIDAMVTEISAAGFPVITIELSDVYDLGREFFRWEFAIAIAGYVLGINPFDEPNVQESKDNTARVLKEFASTGKLQIEGLNPETPEALAAIEKLIASATPGRYLAITAYLEQTSHTDEEFAYMRGAVRNRLGAATTLGYGPRFLHSTGQLHKGGPPTGVFLQVVGDAGPSLPIRGMNVTFGQLKLAQAIGDRQALIEHGLPVITIDVGSGEQKLDVLRAAISEAVAVGG